MVDQFKTQVMFLHPEPSLMEPAASLLGDDYSVHMAASGTEALTTLGITPIDIIVSAQDLPGMSGQEALREAKRRSPDTRGILLASPEMTESDRAALVNIKHLNRVLGHGATADEICSAIRQSLNPDGDATMKPANDQSAGPRASAKPERKPATAPGHVSGPYDILADDIPVVEPGAANDARPVAQSISEVEIVVLTNDGSFLKTIRAATGASHVVNHAPNLQAAVDIVREGHCGVLITDAAVAVRDVETITAKLRRHMPTLVTVVAGRREDGEKMMGLISDGLVYRFLLKPISPGRTRLAIEASAKKHLTLANTEVPLTPSDVQQKMTETGIIKGVTFDSGLFRTTDVRPATVTAPQLDEDDVGGGPIERLFSVSGLVPIALVVVALAVVGVFLFAGGDDDATPAADAPADAVATPPAEPAPAPAPTAEERAATLAARGDRALRDGRLIQPADDNAVVYYAQAAALVRGDQALRTQLESVLQRVFDGIEQSLLADRVGEAAAALAVLNETVPGHPRLAFYNRQVSREVARRDLERVETAIVDGDTEAATEALNRLAGNGITDPAIVTALRERIDAMQAATPAEPASVDDLLEVAALRVSESNLIRPDNDSARFYYQAVIDRDPDNVAARQGLTFVAGMLLSESKTAAARGELAEAGRLLDEAVATGANRLEAAALRSELAGLAGQAPAPREPAAETRTAPPPASGATKDAPPSPVATRDTAPDGVPSTDASQAATPDAASSTDDSQTATQADTRGSATPSAAQSTPAASGDALPIVTPPPVPKGTDAARVDAGPSVAKSSGAGAAAPAKKPEDYTLVQTRYEPPRYPRAAQRRGIEGWADVEFIVRADGTPDEVSIVDSQPGSVFDNAAIDAVRDWRYKPLDTADPDAFARARIRLEFNLEN